MLDNSAEEISWEGIIILPPIGALFAALYYLYIQIWGWIKTAGWQTITLYKSLTDIKIIDSEFYFNFPHALGIQKLLNSFLGSSAPVFYFISSLILFFVCVPIMCKLIEYK